MRKRYLPIRSGLSVGGCAGGRLYGEVVEGCVFWGILAAFMRHFISHTELASGTRKTSQADEDIAAA